MAEQANTTALRQVEARARQKSTFQPVVRPFGGSRDGRNVKQKAMELTGKGTLQIQRQLETGPYVLQDMDRTSKGGAAKVSGRRQKMSCFKC